MVNEFYAALLNKLAINSAPGADFVPSTWQPRHESTAASAIRRALLINPDSSVAANWRANEIRRVIDHSDMSAMLKRFDDRTGYCTHEMQADMVNYLRPRIITNEHPERVKVYGRLKTKAFEIRTWKLRAETGTNNWLLANGVWNDNGQWLDSATWEDNGSNSEPIWVVVTDSKFSSTSIAIDGPRSTQIVIPGTEVRVSFDASVTSDIYVTLGSAPSITLADTARELRDSLRSQIVDLANLESTLDPHDRKMLRDIVLYNGETGAQLGSAAALLAGATLASPAINNYQLAMSAVA